MGTDEELFFGGGGGCRLLKIIPGSFLLKRQDFSGIMYLKNLLTWPLVFTVDNI